MSKRTMTLNLTEAEMAMLEELREKKELSKTALLRQALRLYQVVEEHLESGGKLFLRNEATDEKLELVML